MINYNMTNTNNTNNTHNYLLFIKGTNYDLSNDTWISIKKYKLNNSSISIWIENSIDGYDVLVYCGQALIETRDAIITREKLSKVLLELMQKYGQA